MAAKKKTSKKVTKRAAPKPAVRQKEIAKKEQSERSGDFDSGGNASQSNLGIAGQKRREEEKARLRSATRYLG